MNTPLVPNTIVSALGAVQQVITHFSDRGIIIGGVAVSLLSTPRFTADVDAVLLLTVEDVQDLVRVAEQQGLLPRIDNLQEFARKNRVVLLQHVETGVNVDISLGILPFEVEAVERGKFYHADQLNVRLPTPDDLIILKAVAHRAKDLADIESIVGSCPELDWLRIEYWVQQFAQVLEMPEIWSDIVRIRSAMS